MNLKIKSLGKLKKGNGICLTLWHFLIDFMLQHKKCVVTLVTTI